MSSLPQRTQTSGFKGFGFAAKPGTGAAAPKKPGAGRGGPGSAAAGSKSSVSALFSASLEDESEAAVRAGGPSWAKPTSEALQAQRKAAELLAEDPSVFQYDEVIDDIREKQDVKGLSQNVRATGLQQKSRVGLTLLEGAENVRTGSKRQAKYIDKVITATDRRRAEQQIVEDRLLKKEKEQNKDCEVFVTSGFKEELKRRKKFEDELEEQDFIDSKKAATKQENGLGFASMYRNLLNGGLATSRGGEVLRDQAPARVDETMEEMKEEVKEEAKKEEFKEEDCDSASALGVQDALPEGPLDIKAAKRAEKENAKKEEEEERASKAMTAKERYLARKRLAAESAATES